MHRHAIVKYTGMRVGLFAVALGLLLLVPVRGPLLVALALIISGLASYVLLGPQREAMSAELFAVRERRRARAAARAAREDHLQRADDDVDGSVS